MPRTGPPYAPEFRRQIVEIVQAGRTPEERYAFPRIGKMPVVGGNPRRRAGGPIWHEKVETARAPTVMLAVA